MLIYHNNSNKLESVDSFTGISRNGQICRSIVNLVGSRRVEKMIDHSLAMELSRLASKKHQGSESNVLLYQYRSIKSPMITLPQFASLHSERVLTGPQL
jgi:uncharacterized protein YpbB